MNRPAREEITQAFLEARKLLAKSRTEFSALSESDLVSLHERLEQLADRLGGLIPGATQPSRIEDFFTQVGEGMVAAQAELDRRSFSYNAARPPGALPSVYRIPKVHAEIGFTMSRKRQKQFGVFALGRLASGEKTRSNSVSFEIVSAPPPPQALEDLPIGARLVTRPAERDQIERYLSAAAKENAASQSAAGLMLFHFDRVLILTHEDAWLLIDVVLVDEDIPATLLFGVLKQEPLRYTSHGPLPPSQARQGRWVQVREFLGQIADEQKEALRLVDGATGILSESAV